VSGAAARVVAAVVVLVALLAATLLALSFVPSATLAGRLFGVAGEARSGAFTQDLLAHLDERLRLAAALLLGLAAGLTLLRARFEDLVRAALGDFGLRRRLAWRSELIWLGAAMALAIGIRLVFINQPMRYDEALTFNEFASRPLYYGLSFYPDPNNHLLNTLLVHVAFVGLGNQPWVLRLPALLAGVLLVPATYALARTLYDAKAAALSGVLVATLSYLVEYSTNSRGYTLQALCFVGMLGLAAAAVRRDRLTALLLAAFVGAAGAYAVPTMLYGVTIVGAWLALEMRRSSRSGHVEWRHVLASGLILGLVVTLVYLPVILISGPDKLVANRFVVPLDAGELAAQLPRSLAQTWALWNRDIPWPLAGLLVVGFVAATMMDLQRRRVPLGILAPVVCLGLVLIQRVAPFERVWLFLLPLYCVLASAGLARFVDGRVLAVVFGATVGFATLSSGSILRSTETGAFPDAEAVARSLSGRLSDGDAVVTTLPASLPELQYYFPRSGLPVQALVRLPDDAAHLYVIVAVDRVPSVAGWTGPVEIGRYPESALFALERG
jgi:hypothetical protein